MKTPSNKAINIFRGFFVFVLFLSILNGVISQNPRFSSVSSWGPLWQGLFLTTLVSWLAIEVANRIIKKRGLGTLPAYFWGVGAALNGADFFNSYTSLFEIPNYDKFVHGLSGFLAGMLFLVLFKKLNENKFRLPKAWVYFFTISALNIAGIVYEFAELVGDKYLGANNILGPFDTTGDIMLNNVGVILVILIDWMVSRIKSSKVVRA